MGALVRPLSSMDTAMTGETGRLYRYQMETIHYLNNDLHQRIVSRRTYAGIDVVSRQYGCECEQ